MKLIYLLHNNISNNISKARVLAALLCITQLAKPGELSEVPLSESQDASPRVSFSDQPTLSTYPTEATTMQQQAAEEQASTPTTSLSSSAGDAGAQESQVPILDTEPGSIPESESPTTVQTGLQVAQAEPISGRLKAFISTIVSTLAAPFKRLYNLLQNTKLSSGEPASNAIDDLKNLFDTISSAGGTEELESEITKVTSELEEAAAQAQLQNPAEFDKADFDALRQALEAVTKEVYNSDLASLAANQAQSTLSAIPAGSLSENVRVSYQNFLDTLKNPVVEKYAADQVNALGDVKEQAKALLDPFRSQLGEIYKALEQAAQEAPAADKASFDTLEQSARVLAQKYYGVDIELLAPDITETATGDWQNQLKNTQASLTQLNTFISEMPSSLGFAKGKARDVQELIATALPRIETATTPADRLKALFSLRKAISEVNAFQNYLSEKITPPEGQEAEAQALKEKYLPALEAQQQLTQAVSNMLNGLLAKLPNKPELESQAGNVERVQSLLTITTQKASSLLNPVSASASTA